MSLFSPFPLLLFPFLIHYCQGLQTWEMEPNDVIVNPSESITLHCKVNEKKGDCRWEKDGSPIGLYAGKYEWSRPEMNDCSLAIFDAQIDYDDGIWQCQVTASSYSAKDSLISRGATLIVRESPSSIVIQQLGSSLTEISASAGDDVSLECISGGGNPPPKLIWTLDNEEISSGFTQENRRPSNNSRTWISVSKLILPLSRKDNGGLLKCLANHPTLIHSPLSSFISLNVYYAPFVTLENSSYTDLEENKDSLHLKCIADGNPTPKIIWRKEGDSKVISTNSEISFSPLSRNDDGLYTCSGENNHGLSEPITTEIKVQYPPNILSVEPSSYIRGQIYNSSTLTCRAEGHPSPHIEWLQQLPHNQVIIRSFSSVFKLENITYGDEGTYVCRAVNEIKGEKREISSSSVVLLEVFGLPIIESSLDLQNFLIPQGSDVTLNVSFCSHPSPSSLSWNIQGDDVSLTLSSNSGSGRFLVLDLETKGFQKHCYVSSLLLREAGLSDTGVYSVLLENEFGKTTQEYHLTVTDHVSMESLIAGIVGGLLTVLAFLIIIIYLIKVKHCCLPKNSSSSSSFKPSDLESEKTDVESTHSSGTSGSLDKSIIPPDALYISSGKVSEKNFIINNSNNSNNIHDSVCYNSKVRETQNNI